MILAGDVGGTKTRLALFQLKNGVLERKQTDTYASSDHTGLGEVVQIFLDKYKAPVSKACFGVPGPIINGEARATNLPWDLNEGKIQRVLGIPAVKLVNDLVAAASAVTHLTSDDLLTLHKGKTQNTRNAEDAIIGILAPGTGLGQSFVHIKSGQYYVMASEGGHADFAPTNDIEIELLRYLKSKYGRVSYERVLSGPGLVNVYKFLRDTGFAQEPPELSKRLRDEDPGRVITSAGKTGLYDICTRTLDIFASVLGAQAANLVLTVMATGGIYLGGGIPTVIYKKLAEGTTVASYLDKGRLSNIVKDTPLYVILDDHAALLGAAHLALTL